MGTRQRKAPRPLALCGAAVDSVMYGRPVSSVWNLLWYNFLGAGRGIPREGTGANGRPCWGQSGIGFRGPFGTQQAFLFETSFFVFFCTIVSN
jgi:hypothetical protein